MEAYYVTSYNACTVLLETIRKDLENSPQDIQKIKNLQRPAGQTRVIPARTDFFLGKVIEAIKCDNISMLKSLLRRYGHSTSYQFPPTNLTLLHIAVYYSSCTTISYLVQQKSFNVNSQTLDGETALMIALSSAPSDAVAFYLTSLISQHESFAVDAKDSNGSFPLIKAIQSGFAKTADYLFTKPFRHRYSIDDIAWAIKAAAFWKQNVIGQILVGSLEGSLMPKVLRSLGHPRFPLVADSLNENLEKLLVSTDDNNNNEECCRDAEGTKLFLGCTVQTLSKEQIGLYFPAGIDSVDIARFANQTAVIHEIMQDSLHLHFIELKVMENVKPACVRFVDFGQHVRISDESTVTVGRFVKITSDYDELIKLQGQLNGPGDTELTCGKTGRIISIRTDETVRIQFPMGYRFDFKSQALECSYEDELESCDKFGNIYRKGMPLRVCKSVKDFVSLQTQVKCPCNDEYGKLLGKLVKVESILVVPFSTFRIVEVMWKGRQYCLNTNAVTVISSATDPSEQEIQVGDKVSITEYAVILKEFQTPECGGWMEEMAEEQEGIVEGFAINPYEDLNHPLVKVKLRKRSFYFNPKSIVVKTLVALVPDDDEDSDELEVIIRSQLECIGAKLGEGAFGAVYKGKWTLENGAVRVVAIKQMAYGVTSNSTYDDIMKEARTQYTLRHPNIVRLYGLSFGPQESLWLVMKFVPGVDLQTLLFKPQRRRQFDLTIQFKIKMCLQISDAISYIHEQGYVHQDIKPSNIMVDREGKLYICDFGLARFLGRMDIATYAKEYTENIAGTLLYVAPECLWRNKRDLYTRPTFKSDLWSLGAVFYELFTERQLFDDAMRCLKCKLDNDYAVVRRLVMTNLPSVLRDIVKPCLKFEPRRRTTVDKLIEKLYKVQSSRSFSLF